MVPGTSVTRPSRRIELVLTDTFAKKTLSPGQYFLTFRPDAEALPSGNANTQSICRRLSLEERAVSVSIAPNMAGVSFPFGLILSTN